MNKTFLHNIRRSLSSHKANLLDWLKNGDAYKSSILGLNKDEHQNVEKLDIISSIDTALEEVDHGTFGRCNKCSGEVEPERLMLDFTTCVCLAHYSAEQIRELERDLELAAKVQRHLLPAGLPALKGVQIAVMARPAGAVGGGYYDFYRYKDHSQGFAIADVMGKGVPASMLMANLQASLRIMGPDYPDLTNLAVRLNELFRYNLKQIRFITAFLAGFDPDTRVMQYVNAGHHPPLLWNAHSQSFDWLMPTGPAIGLMPEAGYLSPTVQLHEGDMLVMYTDGLVEARNGHKKEFGQDRLAEYAVANSSKTPETFVNGLIEEVMSFGADIRDDLTLMVLKMA